MMDQAVLTRVCEWLLAAHPSPGGNVPDLLAVLNRGYPRQFEAGEILVAEGTSGDRMYVLCKGAVQVMWRDHQDKLRELVSVGAPALLGHWSLIDQAPRAGVCVAASPVVAVVLSAAVLENLIEENSPVGTALRRLLLSSLARQLSDGNSEIVRIMWADVTLSSLQAMAPGVEPNGRVSGR